MKSLILAATVAAALSGGLTCAFAAGTMPCEDMLKDLRAAEAKAKPDAAAKAKIAELETKGVERCNADDDKRADAFFAQAMALLGK